MNMAGLTEAHLDGWKLCNVRPCVPKKTIGTLTFSILKSVHTLISPIILFFISYVLWLLSDTLNPSY